MDGQQTNNGPEQGGQEPVQEPPSPGIPVAQINAAGPYVPGNPIKFDGSKSTDSDGEIVKYHWDFGDDSTADTAIVEHTYTRQGNFIVKLTATDNDNNSAEKTLEIRVSDTDNPRPEAVIVAIGPFEPGKPITLDGTDSRDPDGGEIASYEWGYGNTQKGTGSKVSYTFPEPGTYTISLRVTDDDGLTSSVVIKDIEVKAPDLMPLYTILGIAIAAGLGIATLWQNRRKKNR
jgi:chitodextrinase